MVDVIAHTFRRDLTVEVTIYIEPLLEKRKPRVGFVVQNGINGNVCTHKPATVDRTPNGTHSYVCARSSSSGTHAHKAIKRKQLSLQEMRPEEKYRFWV